MRFLELALKSIPQAAASPLAFIAYVTTVGAWILAWTRDRQLKTLLEGLKEVPESQRPAHTRTILGEVVPATISVEEWIQVRRQRYLFYSFLAFLFLILGLVGIAAWIAANKEVGLLGPGSM
jgi:hypothetical protein